MIYSCFNQQTGLYDYFEDTSTRPINADLPIPKLPASTGRIGVPAIEAGRPLPTNAVPRGRGWNARGMVVQCRNTSMGALDLGSPLTAGIIGGGVLGIIGAYFILPKKSKTVIAYAAAAAFGGFLGYSIKSSA